MATPWTGDPPEARPAYVVLTVLLVAAVRWPCTVVVVVALLALAWLVSHALITEPTHSASPVAEALEERPVTPAEQP